MAARKIDLNYADKLWQMFKTVDGKHVVSPEAIKSLDNGMNADDASTLVRIYGKAAAACQDAGEFLKILETNEFPPIKLTQKEMEFVRGGKAAYASLASASKLSAEDSGKESGSCHGRSDYASKASNSSSF